MMVAPIAATSRRPPIGADVVARRRPRRSGRVDAVSQFVRNRNVAPIAYRGVPVRQPPERPIRARLDHASLITCDGRL
jgi:hypothetical protein